MRAWITLVSSCLAFSCCTLLAAFFRFLGQGWLVMLAVVVAQRILWGIQFTTHPDWRRRAPLGDQLARTGLTTTKFVIFNTKISNQ